MQQRNFNFSYMFQYNDINIYDEGERAYNTTYKYHLAEFGFSDVWYQKPPLRTRTSFRIL